MNGLCGYVSSIEYRFDVWGHGEATIKLMITEPKETAADHDKLVEAKFGKDYL